MNSGRIELLKGSTGNDFLGVELSKHNMHQALMLLRNELGLGRYRGLRKAQIKRDAGRFHITVLSAGEYKGLKNLKDINFDGDVRFEITGIGFVKTSSVESFFVIVTSDILAQYRRNLKLPPKDFHVSLGFDSIDIHGVSKGVETQIIDLNG